MRLISVEARLETAGVRKWGTELVGELRDCRELRNLPTAAKNEHRALIDAVNEILEWSTSTMPTGMRLVDAAHGPMFDACFMLARSLSLLNALAPRYPNVLPGSAYYMPVQVVEAIYQAVMQSTVAGMFDATHDFALLGDYPEIADDVEIDRWLAYWTTIAAMSSLQLSCSDEYRASAVSPSLAMWEILRNQARTIFAIIKNGSPYSVREALYAVPEFAMLPDEVQQRLLYNCSTLPVCC